MSREAPIPCNLIKHAHIYQLIATRYVHPYLVDLNIYSDVSRALDT